MKHPTLNKYQTEWMQAKPKEIYYFKCKVCEMRFSYHDKDLKRCPYCRHENLVRIPLCAFIGKKPGRAGKAYPDKES